MDFSAGGAPQLSITFAGPDGVLMTTQFSIDGEGAATRADYWRSKLRLALQTATSFSESVAATQCFQLRGRRTAELGAGDRKEWTRIVAGNFRRDVQRARVCGSQNGRY